MEKAAVNLKGDSLMDAQNTAMLAQKFFYQSSGPEDDLQAFRYAKGPASQGDGACLLILALLHLEQRIPSADLQRGLTFLNKSCDTDYFKAFRHLGLLYLKGDLLPLDKARAVSCFEKARALGDITAVYLLGTCYETGCGTLKNPEKAFQLYLEGSERGDHVAEPAIRAVARCLLNGIGTKKDPSRAAAWLHAHKTVPFSDV